MTTYSLRHHMLSWYQANSFLLVSPSKAASFPVSQGIMSFHPSKPEQNLSSVTCLPSPKHQIYQIMAVLPFNCLSTPTPHHILTSLKVIFLRHKSDHLHTTQIFQWLATLYRIKSEPHFCSPSLLYSRVLAFSYSVPQKNRIFYAFEPLHSVLSA